MTRRVVITGAAALSPLGCDLESIERRLRNLESGVVRMAEWEDVQGLRTQLAAPVKDFHKPKHFGRKQIRTMDRVALLATYASELALQDAQLFEETSIRNKMGVAYGSCAGGMSGTSQLGEVDTKRSLRSMNATTYVRMMAHTCASNISIHFQLTGRMIPTCSACTSGSQAVGYAYEAIKHGYQTYMLAGGAEELSVAQSGVFDIMYASSTRNDEPHTTPRPFDQDRDGLVVGEGATTLVLEDYDNAISRGARIYAEIVGFSTNSNGVHITQPHAPTMAQVMKEALQEAKVLPEAVGYINAHATATDLGDIVESQATHQVFGSSVPISSIKGYTGHTLGAAGALETLLTMMMLEKDWYAPNLNLDRVDPRCAELDYILGEGRTLYNEYVMTNNFAFGGVNTSILLKRFTR